MPTPTAILKGAKHPEEAKVFVDFLLSREGQELMQRLAFKYSVRTDVTPLEGKPPFGSLNILLPKNAEEYTRKRDIYINEFNGFLEEGL